MESIAKTDFVQSAQPSEKRKSSTSTTRLFPSGKNPHFVTLTVKACKAEKLDEWVKKMYKAFNLIQGRCKKRHQRGKGIKLIGVKSLECNFNPMKKTYNPHFHIIVPSAEVAHLLRREWIDQWKPTHKPNVYYNKHKYASPAAQDIRKINDLEHALIETIKYGSKIFTEPDLKKKSRLPKDHTIYASALHNIFTAMQGKRLFDRFGFNLPHRTNKSTLSHWVIIMRSGSIRLKSAIGLMKQQIKP